MTENTACETTGTIKESSVDADCSHSTYEEVEQNHVYEDIGDQKIASTEGEYTYSKGVSDLLKTEREYLYSKGVPDFLKTTLTEGAVEREYPYSEGVPDFLKTESAMEREYPYSKGVPDFINKEMH